MTYLFGLFGVCVFLFIFRHGVEGDSASMGLGKLAVV